MLEIKELYIGLPYDIGDGTIDHAFTDQLLHPNTENLWDEMPDLIFIGHNSEIFVRLK